MLGGFGEGVFEALGEFGSAVFAVDEGLEDDGGWDTEASVDCGEVCVDGAFFFFFFFVPAVGFDEG